jgi:hypothetical protein
VVGVSIFSTPLATSPGTSDLSFHSAEENIGIIAACIPALKPLFKKDLHFPWSKNWSYPWSKGYDGGGYRANSDSEQQLRPLPAQKKGLYYPNVGVVEGNGRHVVEVKPPGGKVGEEGLV